MDYSRQARIDAMRAAGWPDAIIPLAVAVSLAEWGGTGTGINNTAYPDKADYHPVAAGNSPEYSVGPWQINLLAHHDITEAQAMDLHYSTKYALDLSKGGTSLTAWGAFTNGQYRKFFTGTSALSTTESTRNVPAAAADSKAPLSFGSGKERTIASTPFGNITIKPDVGLLVKLGATTLAAILLISGVLNLAKGKPT